MYICTYITIYIHILYMHKHMLYIYIYIRKMIFINISELKFISDGVK